MKPAVRAADLTLVAWEGLSFEEWRGWAPKIGRWARTIQWIVGEWVLAGERFGERYAQAVEETGLAPHTILNILSVMRAFPDPSRRREALSFAHHETLARFAPAEQDRWLDAAERGGWSVKRLKTAIAGTRPRPRPPAADPDDERLAGPPHLIVGSLVAIGDWGLCKVVTMIEQNAGTALAGVVIRCVRL